MRLLFLVLLQVLILDKIQLGGYINPYIYVLFIILLPFETPKWLMLISAFLLGFFVDLFSGTGGMHASACVFMAFSRPNVLKMISSRRDYEPGIQPIIRDLGFSWFFSYALILVSIHHVILFYMEAFSFLEFFQTLLRSSLSIAFTLLLLILSQYLMYKSKK